MHARDVWIILLVAVAPIAELRGALPLAIVRGASPGLAFLLAVVGNLVAIPLVLYGLRLGEVWIRRWPVGARLFDWAFGRVRRREHWIRRFGPVGLILWTAIPLPGTGAWTGALAAHVFAIPPRRAIPALAVGVVLAGVLVLLASLGLFRLFGVS